MDGSVALVLAAAGGPSPFVADLGLCLVAAGLLAVAFEKLRIPAIAALLGAGVLIGPAGLEAIADRDNIDTIATLGLTLLLFVIGLEVNVAGLLASGRTLVVTGLLQVPLSLALGFGILRLVGALGWPLADGTYPALYLGIACAFSSTLLVAKFLQEHLLVDSVAGRLCIGLLIFQDVWAIVFMAVQPSLSDPALAPILLTFVGTAVVGVVATLVARFVLSHAFHAVARSPELVVTLALGWCFGVGLFGAHLGTVAGLLGIQAPIAVSMEMGALIAGATIATSPYAYEVVARVTHLRDFFVTLFFVGLGMSIPVPDGASVLLLAAVVAVVAVALRMFVFLPLLYATGLDRRNSLDVSVKLAQVSEFCLVIAYVGARLGHVDQTHVSVIIFAFVLSALCTPFLFAASDTLHTRLGRLLDAVGIRARTGPAGRSEEDNPPRLVLLGFHRVASALLTEIERVHPDLVRSILVIDTNTGNHARLRERGVQVVYGNVATGEVLRHAGIGAAEVIISTVPDELLTGTTNADVVRTVRQIAPEAAIMAGCSNSAQLAQLRAAGAAFVFHLPTEVALGVLPAVYAALNNQLPSYVETADEQHGALESRSHVID